MNTIGFASGTSGLGVTFFDITATLRLLWAWWLGELA